MKSKKGLVKGMVIALMFGIIGTLMVFIVLFTQNMMKDTVTETSTQLQSTGNNLGLDSATINAIAVQETKHTNIDLKIDTLFLLAWILIFGVSLIGAYFSPPLPTFNFLTVLVFGTMFLLFTSNFLGQLMNYLIENLITNVFTAIETNLPVFNFYTENYYSIVIVWLSLLLVANQISNVLSTFENQLREEVEE